jgi:hypothetical protein
MNTDAAVIIIKLQKQNIELKKKNLELETEIARLRSENARLIARYEQLPVKPSAARDCYNCKYNEYGIDEPCHGCLKKYEEGKRAYCWEPKEAER